MARKAARKPRSQKSTRARSTAAPRTKDAILEAMLGEATRVGWHEMSLAAVAEQASMTLGALLTETPSKAHLLARYFDHLDRMTFGAVTAPDLSQEPRDRLFEVMMRRFDALNQNRDGARAVVRGVCRDPAAALVAWVRSDRSGAAMLVAAGLSADGLIGLARIQGLKAIYFAALRAWMRDDTADMATTMAALDRALRGVERLMRFSPLRRRHSGDTAADAEA